MILSITIELDNAAFEEGQGWEVLQRLSAIGAQMAHGKLTDYAGDEYAIRDSNGNRVGVWEIQP